MGNRGDLYGTSMDISFSSISVPNSTRVEVLSIMNTPTHSTSYLGIPLARSTWTSLLRTTWSYALIMSKDSNEAT